MKPNMAASHYIGLRPHAQLDDQNLGPEAPTMLDGLEHDSCGARIAPREITHLEVRGSSCLRCGEVNK